MTTLARILIRWSLMLMAAVAPAAAAAQTTLTADWTNLGRSNLQIVNDGTSLTVGPNAVTINTRVNSDGDANDAGFVPYFSTGILSYYTGQIGAQTGTLLYSMDHSVFDPGDYFETTYTFATAVQSLAFTLANIDRDNGPYKADAVVIEYDTGNGTWVNLRANTALYTLSNVGNTTINGQNGFEGTRTAADITSTNNGIAVAFGSGVTVKRVRIRYHFGQRWASDNPDGASQYIGLSDFTWTQAGIDTSDLSLTGTVTPAVPASGATVTYTVRVANAGPQAASGVVVSDPLPSGFTFVSASATSGSYNATTGLWSGVTVASSGNQTLTITGTASAPPGVTISNVAEIYSSPNYDPDSTPNNFSTAEDDRVALSYTMAGARTAGTAPTLSCPAGSSLFDWDLNPWPANSLANSYSLANIGTIGFSIASPGTWTGSPMLNSSNNGGLAGTQMSLFQSLDFNNQSETATTTITLPTAVPGVQFRVFDVDYAANDFADKLTVTGSFNGSPVTPTLTNGVSNYVVGNSAFGDAASGGTSGDGNVVVTFASPVDTIVIVYGNHNTAPANPDGQAISIWDITFCNPVAVLGVTKVSTLISDPLNGTTNPRAIPGAVMEYCILMQNPGSGTATNISGVDTIPAALTYTPGSMYSGASCGTATTAEDDDASGADESDSFGASVSGSVLTATAASLGPSAGFALKYRATIK